jgi:hypothetical protein
MVLTKQISTILAMDLSAWEQNWFDFWFREENRGRGLSMRPSGLHNLSSVGRNSLLQGKQFRTFIPLAETSLE